MGMGKGGAGGLFWMAAFTIKRSDRGFQVGWLCPGVGVLQTAVQRLTFSRSHIAPPPHGESVFEACRYPSREMGKKTYGDFV